MSISCKGVIFDLDGTLLDTIEDLSGAMNYTLYKHNFPTHPLSHHKKAIGNGTKKYSERSLPKEYKKPEFISSFTKEVLDKYRTMSTIKTVPYDGIFELLCFLKDENIKINVLSNKRDDFVKELIPHYFGNFDFVCANGEIDGIPRKPHPASALNIANMCSLSPSEMLIIGDSIYDVQTGKAANMKTVAAAWGYQPEELLIAENPDFLAKKPTDIIDYIKNSL